MSQEALDFGRLYTVAESSRSAYRLLNDAVAQVGALQAAGACGTNHGDLRRSLDRDGRRLALEHAMAIGAVMDNSDLAYDICTAIVKPFGFVIGEPRAPMTDKERADRCESALRLLGPVGEQALRAALGGG